MSDFKILQDFKITAFKLFSPLEEMSWLSSFFKFAVSPPLHLFVSLKFLMRIPTRLYFVFFPLVLLLPLYSIHLCINQTKPNNSPNKDINLGSRCQSLLKAMRVSKCTLKEKTMKDPSTALSEILMCPSHLPLDFL